MKSFRELRVWQLGISLVELVYDLTRSFPKEEIFGLWWIQFEVQLLK